MLSEEALIVLAAFGACGLLALGVAELLWPTRSRRRRRGAESSEPASEPPAEEMPPFHPAEAASPPAPRAGRVHRTSALARHGLRRGRSPYVPRPAAPSDPDGGAPSVGLAEAAASPRGPAALERCLALHTAGRHAEAIADGMAEIRRADPAPAENAGLAAALWSVVARAREALGEAAEARAALESAIDAAPEADRPTYQRQLAALAGGVARALIADADAQARGDAPARLGLLEQATAWAECAAAADPGDTELAAQAADAQARLWPAYERAVVAHVQRQEFRAARQLLRRVLADPRVPGELVERFHELFSTTFSGEIGQLTAQAIRDVQDDRETDAVAALQRVESLLERLSDQAIPPERREEVGRRLSWGYRKLGERRLDAGDPEGALDAWLRALAHEADPERRRETEALVVRAVDALTQARAAEVRALAARGDREAARAQCEALSSRLQEAGEQGLPLADLARALVQVQGLLDDLPR